MQSSCNLIKSDVAANGNGKVISTNYKNECLKEEEFPSPEGIDFKSIMKSYESIGSGIIKNARKEAEEIILRSLEDAAIKERSAYEEGYSKGLENGYEDGYKEGNEKALKDMESKVKEEIEKAERILSLADEDYKNYMDDKKSEILNLALEMAKIIAGKELQLSEGVLHLIEPILERSKGEENIVIKSNPVHSESIRERLGYWQTAYAIKGEIFVLEDTLMESGNVEIQKTTGKVVLGMDVALEKLEEIILK